MAITATLMNYSRECMGKKLIDFPNDVIKLALNGNSSSTWSIGTLGNWNGSAGAKGWADTGVSSNELANGSGYTTGGNAIGTKAVTYGSSRVRYSSAAVQWTASGSITTYFAFLYDDTATGKPLLIHMDLGGAQNVSSGGTLTISPDATDGWFYL